MLDAVYARLEMKREAGTSNVIHRYAVDIGGMHRAIEISRLQNPSFDVPCRSAGKPEETPG
jgi:hypothetical protein